MSAKSFLAEGSATGGGINTEMSNDRFARAAFAACSARRDAAGTGRAVPSALITLALRVVRAREPELRGL